MYTQCEKCKAIYHVNMREVTIAKGLLRCGECNAVFNASKNLSTVIPKNYQELQDDSDSDNFDIHDQLIQAHRTIPSPPQVHSNKSNHSTIDTHGELVELEINKKRENFQATPQVLSVKESTPKSISKLSINIASFLALLLVAQFLYKNHNLILDAPVHEPEKIQMLNHNVFAHPNEPDVLLISAQIENMAKSDQAYPVLELSLRDAQSNLVALRRFFPEEYLTDYKSDHLIPPKTPITLKLKIRDPGKNATHFQFEFL